jgi:hypothetical protein
MSQCRHPLELARLWKSCCHEATLAHGFGFDVDFGNEIVSRFCSESRAATCCRVDRLGSKAEASGLPIVVFEPYLEGTQDEKQFRVMKDRERWFNVVMGERLELDDATTDRQENWRRVPR